MNYKFILFGLLLIGAFSSCQKSQIEIPESNDPIFRIDGSFGSENISIVAGDNNGFMYTMTSVVNGVDVVSGRLKDDAISIELGIYNGGINKMNEEFDANMSLTPMFSEHYDFAIATLSKDLFINAANIESIEWIIDGGPPIMNSVEIYEPGRYSVCATVKFNNTQQPVNLCNEVIIGYNRYQNEAINFNIDAGVGGASTWINNELGTIEYVDWFYDGSFYLRGDSCFKALDNQMHELVAEVHYNNGVIQLKNMRIDGSVSGRTLEDFTMFEDASMDFLQDYNIKVNVIKAGVSFYSEFANNETSEVEITNVELYGLNDQGNQVYKVNGMVSCSVSDTFGGNTIPLSFSTVFGFEVK